MIIRVFFAFLLTASCLALDINGRFTLSGGDTQWLEGEIKEVKLVVWPLSDINFDDVRNAIENKDFCEYFFIGKVKEIAFSKNNPEALEISADATLKKAFDENKLLIWSYLALNIPIDTTTFKTLADNEKLQDFITLSVDREDNSNTKVYLALGCILFLIIISIAFYKYKKTKSVMITTADWKKIVLKAESREEIEFLYQNKNNIMTYFGGENPSLLELFKRIDIHQYKKSWSEDDEADIKFILDEIKESLQ